jgi:galactoside O-acetyltransferase
MNLLKITLQKIYSLWIKCTLKKCGRDFSVIYPSVIVGGENISVGSKFHSMGQLYLYANQGDISIGDNVNLNTNVVIGSSDGKIVIGNNVLIGPNTVLRAANHGIQREKLINEQKHDGGTIVIKDDVWLGSNVVILKDVIVETGTVVAAGSVVTQSTEAYSIVAGIPAKKIGLRD